MKLYAILYSTLDEPTAICGIYDNLSKARKDFEKDADADLRYQVFETNEPDIDFDYSEANKLFPSGDKPYAIFDWDGELLSSGYCTPQEATRDAESLAPYGIKGDSLYVYKVNNKFEKVDFVCEVRCDV